MSTLKTMKRPVNINLLKIKLPLTALLSITHRLSGMFIFFIVMPVSVISLSFLLESSASYELFKENYNSSISLKIIFLSLIIIFKYHIFTGVRHMLMDFHLISESLASSYRSSQITLILFLADSLLTAVVIL